MSHASGSTSFILAVYADCRTMPNGRGSTPPFARTRGCLGGCRFGAIRHILPSLQRFEESEQSVIGTKPDWFSFIVRRKLGERRLLEGEMCMQVSLRGFDRLVTEPQRDHGAIDACLQQLHCGAVPQHVR